MNRQIIYTFGYPKSGTTYLARLLGDALNSPVGGITPEEDDKCMATEGQDRPGPYYIRHGHAVPVEDGDGLIPDRFSFACKHLTSERVVILLRDPRDVAVSAAAYWGIGLEKTLHCMGHGEWPLTHGGGWCEWIRAWSGAWNFSIYDFWTKYKLLDRDATGVLKTVLLFLDTYARNDLNEVVARQSFTARRTYTKQHGDTLNYGKDAQLRFLRKGVVGDWENHFIPEHRRLAEGYFGEMMRELGYTENEEWVNE